MGCCRTLGSTDLTVLTGRELKLLVHSLNGLAQTQDYGHQPLRVAQQQMGLIPANEANEQRQEVSAVEGAQRQTS